MQQRSYDLSPELIKRVRAASKIVLFTGSGISAEIGMGLTDFPGGDKLGKRSPKGGHHKPRHGWWIFRAFDDSR